MYGVKCQISTPMKCCFGHLCSFYCRMHCISIGRLLKMFFLNKQFEDILSEIGTKKVREKSRECHSHKPQPFPDPKRKRKPTNLNKHKPNKRTKSTKISSLFPKRGNRNTKRTEKHKNKMTHGKTYNKSPRRINHKATRSKTITGTTALETRRQAKQQVQKTPSENVQHQLR